MDGERSYARIAHNDLKRLLAIARLEREDFFSRHKEYAILYRKRVLCAALCGDGALHFSNGQTGIRAFEVWTFYAEHPEASFPHWHEERYDFGSPRKFGRLPDAPESFRGRPVQLAGRSIDASPVDDPIEAVQYYLRRGATPVARRLAEKALVLLEPERLAGYVAWPTLVPARPSPIGAQ
jgi:hypothetical protein